MAKEKQTNKEFNGTLINKIEKDPIKQLRKIAEATEVALQARKPVWERHRKKYRRGLYYLKTFSNNVPIYFTNSIFSTIETYKANVTRFLPKLMAAPRGLADQYASDFMTRLLEDELYRIGFKKTVKEVVHNGALATFGVFKIYFDFDTNTNQVDCIAPENTLIDPNAPDIDSVRWIGNVRRDVPVDEIYAEFGIIPDKEKTSRDLDEEPDDTDDYNSHTDDSGLYTQNGDSATALTLTDNFDVYELWVRDYKNNNWRVYVWAGQTLLKEEVNPYDHGSHPYVVWFDGEDSGADNCYYRGVGSVEEIEPLQDRSDRLDMKIMQHISLVANRQKFVSRQSGLNASMVDNTEGRVYDVNGDAQRAVYYDNPPALSQEVYVYRDATDLAIQMVSGIADVTMGRRPVGVTAGKAMQTLKDSADTRLEEKAESLALAIEKVGQLLLSNILQFFDGERLIKAMDGDKDSAFIVVSDYPEELQGEPVPMIDEATGMPMVDENGDDVIDEEAGLQVTEAILQAREEWKQQNNVKLVLSDITTEWDVKASADSALPATKAERANTAVEMFRLGAIDRQAVLEALDFPNRYQILQRLESDVTGADAGDPNAEEGRGIMDMVGEALSQVLAQMGVPQEQLGAIVETVLGQVQQMSQGGQQSQPGQYNNIGQ